MHLPMHLRGKLLILLSARVRQKPRMSLIHLGSGNLAKVGVASSSLVSRSKFNNLCDKARLLSSRRVCHRFCPFERHPRSCSPSSVGRVGGSKLDGLGCLDRLDGTRIAGTFRKRALTISIRTCEYFGC